MRSRGNWHSSVWELSVIRDSHCMSYADHLPERRASVFCTVVEARQRRRLSRKGTFFLWRALVVWGNQDTRSTPLERAKEPIVLILMAEVGCVLPFELPKLADVTGSKFYPINSQCNNLSTFFLLLAAPRVRTAHTYSISNCSCFKQMSYCSIARFMCESGNVFGQLSPWAKKAWRLLDLSFWALGCGAINYFNLFAPQMWIIPL